MPVDYDALAKQAGAISSAPPPSGALDYNALAKEAGAISSTAPAADRSSPVASSPVGRFASNFLSALNPFPALKHYVWDAPAEGQDEVVAKVHSGDYAGAVLSLLKNSAQEVIPGARSVPDIVRAQAQQFANAYSDLNNTREMPNVSDRLMSAGGHALAGLVPVVGPAAAEAGEQIGNGDVAGGLGKGAGLIASIVGPHAVQAAPGVAAGIEALPGAGNAAAETLRASAEKNIATAINPTTKVNKALVQNKVAPGILDRGITATSLQDLQNQAQAGMDKYGQVIDDLFDQHAAAGTKLSPKPILAALDQEKQAYTVAGVPINEAYVNRLGALQNQIQQVSDANGGAIPLADLRRIRQVHDEVVAQSKGGFALPPDAQSAVNASKVLGNSIRSTFADFVPELADANGEFNFYANLDKVTGDSLLRKTGQRAPLTQKLGQMAGTYIGSALGPAGAVIGGEAVGTLGKLQNSTLWNTLSAKVKTRIADLISAGDEDGAVAVAKQNGVFPNERQGVAPPAKAGAQSNGVSSNGNAGRTGTVTQGAPLPDAVRAGSGTGAPTPGGQGGPIGSSDTVVTVPGQAGRGYEAQYTVKELNDLNASHNGLTFAPNAEYQLTNDRNYSNAVNQGKVIAWASPVEFNPKQLLSDVDDATSGPPVVDSAANVLGGNGRTMILQRVYNGNPAGVKAYRELLAQKAPQFGLDPAAIAGMKQPVLVREIPDTEFLKPGASKQSAITDFNKVGTGSLTPAERAIADSKRVSPETLEEIAARLDAKGQDATLADVLEGKSGGEVLNRLVSDGVVSPQDRAAFMNSSGELTPAGKDRVSKLMLGRFFSSPEQLDSIPASIRNKVERIAAPLAQVKNRPEWNLSPEVQTAVDLLDRANKAGVKNLDDFIRQDGLFGNQKYSAKALVLAKALQAAKGTDLAKAFRQYAQDSNFQAGGNALFGATPTPESSFADAFPQTKNMLASAPLLTAFQKTK